MKKSILTTLAIVILASCDFKKFKEGENKANSVFADQYFTTTIAHIEVYNIRHGHYPLHLDSMDFVSRFDKASFSSLSYAKLDTGYRLDILNGPLNGASVKLRYPKAFWQGLGLKQSNVLTDSSITNK